MAKKMKEPKFRKEIFVAEVFDKEGKSVDDYNSENVETSGKKAFIKHITENAYEGDIHFVATYELKFVERFGVDGKPVKESK